MPDEKSHDLRDFMLQIEAELDAEYGRIRKRTTEDPGTAGDQGEENWKEVLEGWLPGNYKVVTKGRIISADGKTSPQVDVIVLKDTYPRNLINKKLYLAAGVAAVFECKTTLKAADIEKAMESCSIIKGMYPIRAGSPYDELHSPIIYGLLAHSHSWKSAGSSPLENIHNKTVESDKCFITHPRLQLDVLCVADLATWTSSILTHLAKAEMIAKDSESFSEEEINSITTSYACHAKPINRPDDYFSPIGTLISALTQSLAWENLEIRELADYYRRVKISSSSSGFIRCWSRTLYSNATRLGVERGELTNGVAWDKWSLFFGK